VFILLLPGSLLSGTISLGSGTFGVSGSSSDSSAAPAYVTNPSSFAFQLTDGITIARGQQRRNTDSTGGANAVLNSVATFDGRQTTIIATITGLIVADTEGDSGGHSQAFAIGLCTGGWRDQAAATYNLNLLAAQPAPAKQGFSGIAFGYKNGSLYLVGYDYDSQPNQIFVDLGKAALASGNSLRAPITIKLAYGSSTMTVSLNGQPLGSIATSHDFSSALLLAMGGSVDPANGFGLMSFTNLTATTPTTPGQPALLYEVSGDRQASALGAALALPVIAAVVDQFRNPLPGVLVSFAAGNAIASPPSDTTDSNGRASTNVTLGNAPGDANVIASVATLPLLAFHFTAIAGSTVPVIQAVVSGASFGPKISSGGWATILGINLSTVTEIASTRGTTLPTSLDGVSVTIDGLPAFVYYISPTQINVIVPDDPVVGGVNVQVATDSGKSNIAIADKEDFAPELFLFAPRYPAAAHMDGTFLGPPNILADVATRPAKAGEVVLLFGTGFGPTAPFVAAGQIDTTLAPAAQPVSATVGGTPAQVQAYLIYPGMYQFNLTVPDLPPGDAQLSLSVVGSKTQDGVVIPIEP